MTIASEISRLQCAKANICTAIENKGVTVGNVTLSDYASCIDAIQSGGNILRFCYLVVGGGASGAKYTYSGGGGGAGETSCGGFFAESDVCVHIGGGGVGIASTGAGNAGGCSYLCFNDINANITARGGCTPASLYSCGGDSGNGFAGGAGSSYGSGGGGGAAGSGSAAGTYSGGTGGVGITYCGMPFAGGGGGGSCSSSNCRGKASCGGGKGGYRCVIGEDATTCGSGGGGAGCGSNSGAGAGGVVIISYPEDGSRGTASGGNCCFVCNGYCVHMFTSDGTLTVN